MSTIMETTFSFAEPAMRKYGVSTLLSDTESTVPLSRNGEACRSHGDQEGDEHFPFLSVIAPCYNEAEGLPEFYRRVRAVCESIGKTYQIVLVNDGSADATWAVMSAMVEQYPEIVAVNLARNFGQEKALAAGLAASTGDLVLIVDADLQDPPELLPRMLDLMEEGADVVYGQRRSRAGDSLFKRVSAAMFYRLMEKVSEIPIPRDTGFFRLLRRRVVNVLLQMPEHSRYLRGMVSWVGFRQVPLVFDRDPRLVGESHWPLRRMVALAFDALTGFSTRPLRWAGGFAMGTLMMTLTTMACWLGAWAASGQPNLPLALAWIVGGLATCQLAVLFILGEYLGRISEQVRGRPLFIVESVVTSGSPVKRGSRVMS